MSLVHAANYLAAQGRGGDTHLVHMTSKELAAMQKLAESQGKSLTINPQTGLPEAGMLSTVLPMALGALAVATGQVEFLPLIAAGVGAADYAITGSLTQGLMAGLSTWSGGSLAGGIEALGSTAIEEAGKQSVNAGINASLEAGGQEAIKTAGQQAVQEAIKQGADQAAQEAARKAAEEVAKGRIIDEASQEVTKEGLKQAGQYGSSMSKLGQGFSNAGGTGIFDSAANAGKFAMDNKYALAGTALPLLTGGNLFNKNTGSAPTQTAQKNPFGMKEIPRDENGKPIFNASIPTQPNPAYTPVYPDYVKNPYVSGAAGGGLMSGIPGYKGSPDYGSMVEGVGEIERGIEMASKRRPLEVPNPYVEIEPDEPELRRLDPHNRARKMLEMLSSSSRVKMAKGLPQSNVLGAISTDPAKVIAEQRAKEAIAAEQTSQEAKEGGLMSMAEGGIVKGYAAGGMPDLFSDPTGYFASKGIPVYKGTQAEEQAAALANQAAGVQTIGSMGKPMRGIANPPSSEYLNPNLGNDSLRPDYGDPTDTGAAPAQAGSMQSLYPSAPALQNNWGQAAQGYSGFSGGGGGGGSGGQPVELKGPVGIVQMAEGGESHVYKPTYTDYQATPFDLQKFLQTYNPQATSMGLPMNQQKIVGSQGYAIDPSVMRSNAQIAAEREAKRLAELQALQASGPMGVVSAVSDGASGEAAGGLMHSYAMGGGIGHLGSYSDGGHLLRGPGDGVSDSIPATIGGKQPARLAEGEFVIPARIVSELGNGSTDAGAKRLYAMMDRIKAKRAKTKNIAADTKAYKYLPA